MSLRRSLFHLLLVLSAGCADLPELLSLRAALNQEYPNTAIGVRLTDESILTVTLADSPLQSARCESRVAQAMHIATFLREHYQGFPGLRLINIEFGSGNRRDTVTAGAPHYPIRFEPSAVTAGLTDVDSTRAVGNCRTLEELG